MHTNFYWGSSGSQLWDLLTASPSAGEKHKLHLFLSLRLQVQTTWDFLSFFHLLTWLTITRGSCVKGYCSILAPKYSRAQDYIHWHGFWVCSPWGGGGRFPFLWDDATLTVVHNQIWRERQMASADLLLWETGLEEGGSNVPARTSSFRSAKQTRFKQTASLQHASSFPEQRFLRGWTTDRTYIVITALTQFWSMLYAPPYDVGPWSKSKWKFHLTHTLRQQLLELINPPRSLKYQTATAFT